MRRRGAAPRIVPRQGGRILFFVSRDIVYEVRCERCRTSFAPETRRCVHCGAPLATGRRMVSTHEGFDPVYPAEDDPAEEGEVLARGPRTVLWVVIALITALASLVRSCIE
jgi:ribosomal protein L37E